MSTDLTVTHEDNLHERPRKDIEQGLRYWFEVAKDLKEIQNQLVADFEIALNACKHYQGVLATNTLPDPNIVVVRRLLNKYCMTHTTPQRIFKVFVDGIEITEHPDSVEGEIETLELTSDEYYGIETVELIQDSDGEFHLVKPDIEEAAEAVVEEDE